MWKNMDVGGGPLAWGKQTCTTKVKQQIPPNGLLNQERMKNKTLNLIGSL
jgi:hypothetical protein